MASEGHLIKAFKCDGCTLEWQCRHKLHDSSLAAPNNHVVLCCYLVVPSEGALVVGVQCRVQVMLRLHFLQQGPFPSLRGHLGEGLF